MNSRNGLHHHAPLLRPLTCSLLLVLTGLTPTGLMARELVGESEEVTSTDPPEMWVLRNGAQLVVRGGETRGISADDSGVLLNGGTVARNSAFDVVSIELTGTSLLDAINSRIRDGGILIRGSASANLSGSDIVIDESASGFAGLNTVGISLTMGTDASVWLDGSTISVVDNPAKEHFNSGVGIRQSTGKVTLTDGSRIDAANVGVILNGTMDLAKALELDVDASGIHAGRGAAIQVAPGLRSNTYNIRVSNGTELAGGDGNLLLVSNVGFDTISTGHNQVNFFVERSRLDGNITVDDSALGTAVHVYLQDNAHLTGRMRQVGWLGVAGDSTWTMTGDSSVDHLTLSGDGRVELGDGQTFNTLALDTFTGIDGTLVFNTVLEGDDARTDRLVIAGDAEGQANVVVRNAGGRGAQTENGIELIDIGGRSDALFTLQGRATGGLHEYALIKGADGHWYLRSELDDGTDPEPPHECVANPELPQCEITLPVQPIDPVDPEHPDPENPDPEQPDPEEPGKPQPVLRPETGAHLANQAAMGQLLQHNARERMAAARAVEGLRTWAFTGHNEGRMDVTGQQTLRTSQSRLQVGADIGTFDRGQGRVGSLLTAGKAEATARSTVTGYRADARVEGGAAGLYAHWTDDVLYLDASVQRGRFRNRVMGEGVAMERYDTGLWQTTLEAGYRFDAGHLGTLPLHLEPQLQLTHTTARMDAHVESNGTVVERAGGNGLATRVGLRLEGEAALAKAHLTAYLQIDGYHDARRAALSFDGETVEGGAPGSRVALRAGGQLQFGSGLAAWGELGGSQGAGNYRDVGARVGVSYRW